MHLSPTTIKSHLRSIYAGGSESAIALPGR